MPKDLFININKAVPAYNLPIPSSTPVSRRFQSDATSAAATLFSPGERLLTPALKKLGVPAGIAGVAGSVADVAAPLPGGKAKLAAKAGETFRVMKVADLLKAKNVLTPNSERAGSVTYHMNQLANDRSKPINIRFLDKGKLFIEDGRHRLEAAKQLNLPEMLIKDVSAEYKPRFQGKFVNPTKK